VVGVGNWFAIARILLAGIAATMIFAAAADRAAAEPKRIVILNSYGQNFKPWRDYSTALRQELERQSRWPLDIQDFSIATARFEADNVEAEFVDYLRTLFDRSAPDLVVALGGPAAMFVQRHRQQLFPLTPMVMTAVEERRVQRSALTENDAVVAVKQDVPVLFGNIVRLLPATRTIAVVVGDSPNERFWQSEIRKELEPVLPQVNVRLAPVAAVEYCRKSPAAGQRYLFSQSVSVAGLSLADPPDGLDRTCAGGPHQHPRP
jgi:hypothetical protein